MQFLIVSEVVMKNKSTTYQRDLWLDRILLALLVIGILVFILYPIGSVITTSFFFRGELTWKNYTDLLQPQSLTLIRNSLWIGVTASLLTIAASLSIAIYSFGQSARFRKRIESMLMITMISPPFVSALAFIILFGRRGLISYGLFGISINPYGWHGIVILQGLGNISFASLMLLGALNTIDVRQILASRDLGARPLTTLRTIILPALYPTLLSIFFLLFTMNISDFGTPIVIGGNFRVLATEAYLQVISTPHLGRAAAISVLMIPSAVIAFYFYRRYIERMDDATTGSGTGGSEPFRFSLPKPLTAALACVVGLYFLIMVLKYGNIFLSAVSNTATGSLTFTDHYIKNIPMTFMKSFRLSIVLSVLSGVVASFLGILLAYYMHRRKINGLRPIEFIASLPYIIPGTFYGLGYVAAFSHPPLMIRGTYLILAANLIYRQVSVSNKVANSLFVTLDQRLENASSDLGASRFQTLRNIILPLTRPIFYTSFITIFTSGMTSIGAIAFIVSPGMNLASMELFGSVEQGKYGIASVEAVMMIAVIAFINVIAIFLKNRKKDA